jgi:hypothetical protein
VTAQTDKSNSIFGNIRVRKNKWICGRLIKNFWDTDGTDKGQWFLYVAQSVWQSQMFWKCKFLPIWLMYAISPTEETRRMQKTVPWSVLKCVGTRPNLHKHTPKHLLVTSDCCVRCAHPYMVFQAFIWLQITLFPHLPTACHLQPIHCPSLQANFRNSSTEGVIFIICRCF